MPTIKNLECSRCQETVSAETPQTVCPKCKGAIKQHEKFVEMTEQIWDGAGDSDRGTATKGSKVTLICGNDGCDWRERTEFWNNYVED